jgi:hypothetical protein
MCAKSVNFPASPRKYFLNILHYGTILHKFYVPWQQLIFFWIVDERELLVDVHPHGLTLGSDGADLLDIS